MFNKKYKIAAASLGVLLIFFIVYAGATGVDNTVTKTDKIYIKKILQLDKIKQFDGEQSFSQEIKFISSVQDTVLQKVPHEGGIPRGQTREPADIYKYKSGSCYDRSRLLEKTFRAHGLKTVHLALYKTHLRSAPLALITPKNPSHAISKVKTKKGWIGVDSNHKWINLNEEGEIVPFKLLANQEEKKIKNIDWHDTYAREHQHGITKRPFVRVYGLYSRNGMFYPPFDHIPDINWLEFSKNFTGLN